MPTIPFGKPIIGADEQKAVEEVMASGVLAHGPRVQAFEESFAAFTGAPYAVATGSCTAALHLVYVHLGFGPGDEVIVPAMTHVATAHAVEYVGAKPVFVDAERKTGNIDIGKIDAAITTNTRAISVVHFLGMPVDMERVNAIARKHGLVVVEDCALALGSHLQQDHAGLWGDVGCFSFYPVKHITTGEGGMVITRSASLADGVRLKRAFGMDKHVGERSLPGQYDILALGYNYRMGEMQAAMGIEQLKRLPGFLEKRKANYEALSAGLRELPEVELLQSTHDHFESSYYCLTMILKKGAGARRINVIRALQDACVGTSIYYPHPVPALKYYAEKYGYGENDFPVASRIANQSVALPVGPHLDPDDMADIVSQVKNALVLVKTA